MKKILLVGFILVVCLVIAAFVFVPANVRDVMMVRALTTESHVKTYGVPEKTSWRPQGVRRTTTVFDDINGRQVGYAKALHSDTQGSDEVGTVVAPTLVLDWIAEPDQFVAEGPVFDAQGNVYFTPLFGSEDLLLVSLDPKDGSRRWALEEAGAGAGSPMIVTDPVTGDELIYLATYQRVLAVTTDGEVLYDQPFGIPTDATNPNPSGQHCYGVNHHLQADAIIALVGDGHIGVFDRTTGAPLLDAPFLLPGAKTPVNNISLPESTTRNANRDMSHFLRPELKIPGADPIGGLMHGVSGELQKVTNYFSIDKNTGRIWVAASLPDEADGKEDGWSDYGGLYGLDLVKDEAGAYQMEVKIVFQIDGGTSFTPAVSADGSRIYLADAYDTVYAVDAVTGEEIWSVFVGSKVTGSITVATDNGEIYANTRTEILQILEDEEGATRGWTANLDMYTTGRFQENFKALGAEVVENGIAFTGAVGIAKPKQKFPFKIGAGLLDRETGEIRYFAEGGEDSVSSMATGPGGEIYIGNSPMRRILARVAYGADNSPNPPVGGISKFRPADPWLVARDALFAAANRAGNAAKITDAHPNAAEQDLYQITLLIEQAVNALASDGSQPATNSSVVQFLTGVNSEAYTQDNLLALQTALVSSYETLEQAYAN
ncbi:MAG: PQQ-binding-like beta-propeller repeat protein [Pseudomonadales bacterium]|nr:PQQ-binding-like beta-propeller repeat protein [Pseudomonadales bacterium]